MDAALQLGIVLLGVMVIIGIIAPVRIPAFLGALILLFVFGPILYAVCRDHAHQFLRGYHYWWEYVLIILIILIVLRLLLDFFMPWRRRR